MKNTFSSGRVMLLLAFLAVGFVTAAGQRVNTPEKRNLFVSPFRYVIIENRVEKDPNTTETRLVVEVLLDRKAFSEENLRVLFKLISRRFPDAEVLDAWVYTSLEQAPTPEERDEGTTSESQKGPTTRHYWAFYLRSVECEYFRYSPLADKSNIRTVQLRTLKK